MRCRLRSTDHSQTRQTTARLPSQPYRAVRIPSIVTYTFGDDSINCEVKLGRPEYQDIMTLWSKERPYAHVRLAYEMIPYTNGKVTLLDATGKSVGDLSDKPVKTQTVIVDRGGYGVRIEFTKPLPVRGGPNKTNSSPPQERSQ